MATYLCLDGPLEGRALRRRGLPRRGRPRRGRPVTIALVDVGHGVLEVEYRVQRPADRSRPGDLRFVGARDAWHTPRWRARTRRRLAL